MSKHVDAGIHALKDEVVEEQFKAPPYAGTPIHYVPSKLTDGKKNRKKGSTGNKEQRKTEAVIGLSELEGKLTAMPGACLSCSSEEKENVSTSFVEQKQKEEVLVTESKTPSFNHPSHGGSTASILQEYDFIDRASEWQLV